MSNCRTFNRNRKEQSKPKNVANAEISRLALARINENPQEFIDKLYQMFIKKDRINAAALIVKLADGYTLPEPKETGPRKLSMIEKWMNELEPISGMESAQKKETESAASAEPATQAAETEAVSATITVASEIGIAPQSAGSNINSKQSWEATYTQAGSASDFRPCRNPVPSDVLDPDSHSRYFGVRNSAEGGTGSN